MQRVKYSKKSEKLVSSLYNIVGELITIEIQKRNSLYLVSIFNNASGLNVIEFETKSLQSAKRKSRNIVKDLFKVNLLDEVRKTVKL